MAMDTNAFRGDARQVADRLIGRHISRRLPTGLMVEGVILEADAFAKPANRRASPEWKADCGPGALWVNSRYGRLLTNVNFFEGCFYLTKVGLFRFGQLTSVVRNSGIAPIFGLDKSLNGSFIGEILSLGGQLQGQVTSYDKPKMPDNYAGTFRFELLPGSSPVPITATPGNKSSGTGC